MSAALARSRYLGVATVAALWSTAALLSPAAFGCAAPTAQLSPEMLARMQGEARVEIYDRENDLVIARNREDEVLSRIDTLRRDESALAALGARMDKRTDKAEPDRALKLARPRGARRAYLEAQRRLAELSLGVARASVAAASARLEETRQRQLVRTGRALGATMKPFDDRVEALEKRVRDDERREQDVRVESEKAFETWKSAEDEYARDTGDWNTGIWID